MQRVLDWTQLWYHQLRQHPVCGADCVSVHHHGGLGGHPLQRESICTKNTTKGMLLIVCHSSSISDIFHSLVAGRKDFLLAGVSVGRLVFKHTHSIMTITGQIDVVIHGPQKVILYDCGDPLKLCHHQAKFSTGPTRSMRRCLEK